MILRDIIPHPSLRQFVRYYRIVHFKFDPNRPVPFKAYPPKPEQCLHFFLRDFFATQQANESLVYHPSMLLMGQRIQTFYQYTGNHFYDVQIVFQPTAIFQLTGIPAFELTNQHIDASLIFPYSIQETYHRLQDARDYSEIVPIIEAFSFELVKNVQKDYMAFNSVSRQMLRTAGMGSIDGWASETCLSAKQFKRKFHESIGVNPKTYARVIRFNHAFNLKNRFSHYDWLTIAIECGYYDYQHLVKDYKDFTGLSPTEFHQLENQAPERLLGLADNLYQERIALIA